MKTCITTSVEQAAGFIIRRGIVAFPTETVYGLGANVFDAEAVAKIFEAKRRPADNPLIAHVVTRDQIRLLTREVTQNAEKFIDAFFPGPLTLVLEKAAAVPLVATAALESIGVRMPRSETARRFLAACGTPVVAPSANLSGRPSPTTWQAVAEDLDGRIDCILQGEATEIGLESTVVDCTGEVPVLLRSGAVSLAELRAVVPVTQVHIPRQNDQPRSPGLKHKHYAPAAKVILVDLKSEISDISEIGERAAYIGLSRPDRTFKRVKTCVSVEEYAHALFEFFRECDRLGITAIYCETVEERGIGAALMDRLRRAAEA